MSKFILYTSLICLLFLFHKKVNTVIPKIIITLSIIFLVQFYVNNPIIYRGTIDTVGNQRVTVVIKTMSGFSKPITEVAFYSDDCPIGVLNKGIFLEKDEKNKVITTMNKNKVEYKIADSFVLCEDRETGGLTVRLR